MVQPVVFHSERLTKFTEDLTERIERFYVPADGRLIGDYRMVRIPNCANLWVMAQLVSPTRNRYNEYAWKVLTVPDEYEFVIDIDDVGLDSFNAMEVLAWASR